MRSFSLGPEPRRKIRRLRNGNPLSGLPLGLVDGEPIRGALGGDAHPPQMPLPARTWFCPPHETRHGSRSFAVIVGGPNKPVQCPIVSHSKSTDPQRIEPYLSDESRMEGGRAEEIAWPANAAEASEVLSDWHARGLPVTVSGGGTGVVGGRIPFGGAILATDRMNQILDIRSWSPASPHPCSPDPGFLGGATMRVQAGVSWMEIQQAAAEAGYSYPPDPTEGGCFLGGTLATNASGARSFRFGPTRVWVDALKAALPDGRVVELRRGEHRWKGDSYTLELTEGPPLVIPLPDWPMPPTSKSTAGYHCRIGMDLIDLLVGSEGTLVIFLEAELRLLPAPREMLSGMLFFESEENAFRFTAAARGNRHRGEEGVAPWSLELFGEEALDLLREKEVPVPGDVHGAIFFEEGLAADLAATFDECQEAWLRLAEKHDASADSWLADSAAEDRRFREFRHAIPATINEKLAERKVTKVSTDTAVPEGLAPEMIARYRRLLDARGYDHVVFGHAGDDHVHVNIIPRDPEELPAVKQTYWELIRIAIEMGGIAAAEHGLGKLKARALEMQYPGHVVERMKSIKRAFDPLWRLGRQTLFEDSNR